MSSQSAVSAARVFQVSIPGQEPVRIAPGSASSLKELEQDTQQGTGKWMYGEVAKSFGYNPEQARANPEKNSQVLERLNDSLIAMIALGDTGKGIVEQHTDFRSALAKTTNIFEGGQLAQLNSGQAKLASLPGASTLSNPVIRGGVQVAVNAELRILGSVKPELAAAAKTGLSAGTALAYVAADTSNPPQLNKPAETEPQRSRETPPKLTPIQAALDTDHDGKLVCIEIGVYALENTSGRSANAIAYQDYVSGKPGADFEVVTPQTGKVRFDGCKDKPAGPLLLEAKAQHGIDVLTAQWSKSNISIVKQGREQEKAAQALGLNNELHVQVEGEVKIFERIYERNDITTPVLHTPLPIVKK